MHKKRLLTKKRLITGGVAALAVVAVGGGFLFSGGLRSLDLARAGGVTPTITPSARAVSTSGANIIEYNAGSAMPIGSTIALTYSNAYTGTITTANTTVNTVAPSAVSAPVAVGTSNRVTITTANAITAGSAVTVNLTGLTSPVTAGNYSFTISTNTNDFGGNFQYVGEANVVEVRAFVPLRLSFNIRNAADTANVNVCDLGEATTTTVQTCDYRLKASTNASGGYTISMQTDGNLTNGTHSMTNAAAGATGSTTVAGTERYGVNITAGSTTSSGSITTTTAYGTSASNVVNYSSTTPANILLSTGPNSPASSGDTTNTSLITHKLAIDNNTPVGSYTQRITYKVTPTF